jgi:Lrp/AsnC family transcriptional regulator, leucine-responsive regulatory protein
MGFEVEKLLDETGRAILDELQRNARITFSELARRVRLTPPAVADRVRRMEEAGIIAGYHVEVDRERLGLPVTAFVRISAAGPACAELASAIPGFPEVLECHRVTGEEAFIAKVAVRTVGHLERLIDRLMPYGETITSIVLSSPVTHRIVEPPAADDAAEEQAS